MLNAKNLLTLLPLALLLGLAGLPSGFGPQAGKPTAAISQEAANTQNALTDAERAAGWQLLFDGKTTNGWHTYGKQGVGAAWKVVDGALTLGVGKMQEGHWQAEGGGDIVTDAGYGNFELRLDWKISECGNSGIMFRIVEDARYRYPWETGPEMQVLDNTCHPDAKIPTHRAGCLYDLLTVSAETVRPAGKWNKVRIILRDGHLEQWLNGKKVVETEMWTPAWEQMLANSKWKDYPDFAKARSGKIGLQDHGNGVAFRNIKIREL